MDTDARDALEIEKLKAEVSKLIEETRKTRKEARWYEVVIASGATLAIVAVTKLFL
jgi:hypothetical protein